MAANRKPPTPPHPPSKSAESAEDSLPKVDCLGLSRVGRGFVLIRLTVQGDKILDREVLSRAPEPRQLAVRRAQSELIKAWLSPAKDVSA